MHILSNGVTEIGYSKFVLNIGRVNEYVQVSYAKLAKEVVAKRIFTQYEATNELYISLKKNLCMA